MSRALLIGFFFVALGTSSCMSRIALDVSIPSPLQLPASIQSWVLLDRSPRTKAGLKAPRLLREEEIPDRLTQASILAVEGLISYLNDVPGQTQVSPIHLQLTQKEGDPDLLPAQAVDYLCNSYQTDALIVLESFQVLWDTNAVRGYGIGGDITFEVEVKLACLYTWRIYNRYARVLDQFDGVYRDQWTARGPSERETIEGLPSMTEISKLVFPFIGQQYGKDLYPPSIPVKRKFYARKTGPTDQIATQMKTAAQLALEDQWQEAARIWRPIAENPHLGKVAGRAAYNLGLASEKTGNLQSAHQWLILAKERYQVWGARSYLQILSQRMRPETVRKNH